MGNAFHHVGALTEKDQHLPTKGNLIVIHHLIADDKQIDSLLKLNSLHRDYILHHTFLL